MAIRYSEGYKYQLEADYMFGTGWKLDSTLQTDYVSIGTEGVLVIRKGYAWDGPSGPTLDTKTFMRGSLIHDALYQMIKTFSLGEDYRKSADEILHKVCREDGMGWFRAWYVKRAVRNFGALYSASNEEKILEAP